MVRLAIDHMLALPAVALAPQARIERASPMPELRGLEERLESLESQRQTVQEQVDFLEKLLRRHHALPEPADAS